MPSAPCVLQNDPTDCGPAVLATVARAHGLRVSVGRIRELARTDLQGTSLLALREAARALGFSARGVEAGYDELRTVPKPVIAHLCLEKLDHYVVVHRATARRVLVADPKDGVSWQRREDFESVWSGVLLLVGPTAAVRDTPSAPTPGRRLLALMRPHRGLLGHAFGCAVLFAVLGLASSFYVKFLVDTVFVGGEIRTLHAVGLGMAVLFGFRAVFGSIRHYLLVHLSRKVDLSLMLGYTNHVLELPMRFFATRRVGEVLSRLSDADRIRELVSGTSLALLLDGTMIVMAAVAMFLYDARLALVAVVGLPILLVVVGGLHRPFRRAHREVMERAADLESTLVESIAGIETLKGFGAERLVRRRAETRMLSMLSAVYRGGLLAAVADIAGTTIASFGTLGVLWYGSSLVLGREISVGELMFFHSLVGLVYLPAASLASANAEIQDALIATERLGDYLEHPTEHARDSRAEAADTRGSIRFEDVWFRYGSREYALRGIDLEIAPGKTTALVGESGSGKTTLARLVPRFYDPDRGSVTLGGVDLRDLELASIRAGIGYVPQDPFVLSGSIRENIALGRPDASMADVIAAARKANLHEYVESLPRGYATELREFGGSLSGGQRQRLAIARALLVDPDILILDEATSNLDSESEAVIHEALRSADRPRTTIVIAHRLSTVARADRIVVLEGGAVAEAGTHEELLDRGGLYHDFWRRQFPAELDRGSRHAETATPPRGSSRGVEENGART